MLNINNHYQNDSESGFSNVETQNGQTVRIFALSAEEFEKAKPTEEVFRRVAAIMADSREEITDPLPTTHKKKPLSTKERIRQIVRG